MQTLILHFNFIIIFFVSKHWCDNSCLVDEKENDAFFININVYKIEKFKVWLTIPEKSDEYLETYTVDVKWKNNSSFVKTNNVIYMKVVDTLFIFVSGLSPNTTYSFRIFDKSKNAFSESIKEVTTENSYSGPDKPEENMFYISFEKNEAILTRKEHYHWQDIGTWYVIQLLHVDGSAENLIETKILNANTNANHFTNLRQGYKYKFRIEAHNETGTSESIVTREYIAGNYERPIEVLNFTDTTCTILYKKPRNVTQGITDYVQIIDKGDRNIDHRFTFASSGKPHTIQKLYPGNEYAFAISTVEAKMSPFLETDCTTTPLYVLPRNPRLSFFNISFEYGVFQIKFRKDLHFVDCLTVYDVFIHKKDVPYASIVMDRITCRNRKVGPYYFEPGRYFVMIQACRKDTRCSQFSKSREYTIVKMKEPAPLFYKVLQTTDYSCTIQWMKTRNISDIHFETIWYTESSIDIGYEINFVVIGTDNKPLNIHTAKDACTSHHLTVTPAKPTISDFKILLHSVDPSVRKIQNTVTIKLHNSTNNDCELWYAIQICSSLNICSDKKHFSCIEDFSITYTFRSNSYYFKIAACNKIGCSQSTYIKIYKN